MTPGAAGPAPTRGPSREPATPTILFVGRLDPEKRVGELIDAVAALPADCPARLEIIGDGTWAGRWRAQASELGLGDRVLFRGFVGENDLLEAYGRADVFVMPGVAELQSLVTLEAMSAALPIVAADAMALPHLVHPGVNGFLYPPGNVAALAGRLEDLLRDPGLRAACGRESARLVRGHGLDTTLTAFEEIYAGLAARALPAAA